MSSSLKNYTRGSQTTTHSVRMAKQSFSKMFTTFLLCILVANAIGFFINTSHRERYFLFKSLDALIHIADYKITNTILMNRDTSALIMSYRESNGTPARINASTLVNDGLSHGIYYEIVHSQLIATAIGGGFAFLLNWLIWWYLIRKGEDLTDEKHLRGGSFSESPNVIKKLKQDNNVSRYTIANVPLAARSETQHIMISGAPGTGKTVCISQFIEQIRREKSRAIIYDKMGTYTQRFFREGKDILLNPLDLRFPGWHIWKECRLPSDFDRMAESLMPMSTSGQDPFWTHAARVMFSVAGRKLAKKNPTTRQLLRYLLMADLNRIKEIFANTEAESLVSEDAAKMALSVKAVLAVNLRAMLYLQESKKAFSIRDWVQNDKDDACIFITSREDMHATLTPLIASWIDVASNAILSLAPNIDRRIWLVLDELGSLKYLPSLPNFMEQSRQFGGCTLMGFHSLPQFYKNFGHDGAEEILGVCNTGIHFRSTDKVTSDYVSDIMGEQEIEERSESISYSAHQGRDSVSLVEHKKLKRIILPTEIRRLDDLTAYLRLKGDIPITKIAFNYKAYPEIAPRYIERAVCIDREIEDVINELPDKPTPVKRVESKSGEKLSFEANL